MPQNEVSLKGLNELIAKTYLVEDNYVVKTMNATTINHYLHTEPVWIILVAPPGGGKSEFINMLSKINWTDPTDPNRVSQKVWPISTLTSKTLFSGMRAQDNASLIVQIKSGIITFKDITSLMAERQEDLKIILGQLREIYDGKYDKPYGNGQHIKWSGKITIIGGATYAVYSFTRQHASMGERFIFYNLQQPERIEATRRTMENIEDGGMKEKREEIADYNEKLIKATLDRLPDNITKIDGQLQEDILKLAELATRARSSVEHNWRSRDNEIVEVYPPEMPTRFAGQLQGIIQGLKVLNHYETGSTELIDGDTIIINKIAFDSVGTLRRATMKELARYKVIKTAALAAKMNLMTPTVRLHLEDLNALEICDRRKRSSGTGDEWVIKDNYREIIHRFEGVELEGEEITGYAMPPITVDEANQDLSAYASNEEEFSRQQNII